MKHLEFVFEGCLDCPYRDEYNNGHSRPELECTHPERKGMGWENVIAPVDSLNRDFSPSWCPVENV